MDYLAGMIIGGRQEDYSYLVSGEFLTHVRGITTDCIYTLYRTAAIQRRRPCPEAKKRFKTGPSLCTDTIRLWYLWIISSCHFLVSQKSDRMKKKMKAAESSGLRIELSAALAVGFTGRTDGSSFFESAKGCTFVVSEKSLYKCSTENLMSGIAKVAWVCGVPLVKNMLAPVCSRQSMDRPHSAHLYNGFGILPRQLPVGVRF